jgi:phosphoglycerol transferase MdoB-like AlkP superfamily enzyme
MDRLGLKDICGSGFSGICDTTVAEMMHQELLKRSTSGKPKFVYWMTLNSHLPLDSESSKLSRFNCDSEEQTRTSTSVCLHTRMINLVLSTVASIANDPKLPPTEFIITGDHMPPFMDPRIRGYYSDTDVPSIVLKPRQQ